MKKGLYLCMFLVAAFGLVIAGCGGSGEEAAETADNAATDTADAAPAPLANPLKDLAAEDVVVTVNGTSYTKADVEKKMGEIAQQFGGQIPPGAEPQMAQQALDRLVDEQLLLKAAGDEGVTVSDEEIQQQYDLFSGRAPSPEEFATALTSMGFTEETFRAEIAKNLTFEKLLTEKLANAGEVTDAAVQAYYDENQAQFQVPEQVQASHILINSSADDTEEAKAERRQKLEGLKAEAEGGADFAALAGEHSDCPSKAKGGDLGLFTRERMVKPFSDAAFAMEVGQLSDVVETQFGYHLIKLTKKQPATTRPLEEVRPQVEAFLDRQNKEAAFTTYIEGLRGAADLDLADGFQLGGNAS
jgi:peptidyl-prolyl cis-trans isomerase C